MDRSDIQSLRIAIALCVLMALTVATGILLQVTGLVSQGGLKAALAAMILGSTRLVYIIGQAVLDATRSQKV